MKTACGDSQEFESSGLRNAVPEFSGVRHFEVGELGVEHLARKQPTASIAPRSAAARLPYDAKNVHTAPMSLKNASIVALAATLLLSILLAVDFINTLTGVIRDIIPAVAIIRSFIYLFAAAGATLFFYVFSRSRS
jgi:hypothetical protein